MKEAERRKMGERIRELRERSPYKQRDMARKLRLSTRMYQKVEERGTSKWDRVQKIARIHKVDPYEIWTGEPRGATPKLPGNALTRIEEKLDLVLEVLAPDAAVQAASDAAQLTPESDRPPGQRLSSNARKKAGTRQRAAQR